MGEDRTQRVRDLAQMAAAKEQRRMREQEGKVKVRRSRCRVREKRGAEAG